MFYVQSLTSHFFRQESILRLQSDPFDTFSSKAYSAEHSDNVEKSLSTHLMTLMIVNNTEVVTKFQWKKMWFCVTVYKYPQTFFREIKVFIASLKSTIISNADIITINMKHGIIPEEGLIYDWNLRT
jgi:hypothetical protein